MVKSTPATSWLTGVQGYWRRAALEGEGLFNHKTAWVYKQLSILSPPTTLSFLSRGELQILPQTQTSMRHEKKLLPHRNLHAQDAETRPE